MSLTNYTDLTTSIASWLKRSDLTANIPDFINMAESYMNDDLRLRSMIAEADITPSQVNTYVDLPDGFIEAIAFVDDQGYKLEQIHHDQLQRVGLYRLREKPEFYSVTSKINFNRVATSALTYVMTYYKGLDLATDSTNAVMTKYPNLYLYGSLIQAEPFLKNDKRMTTWHSLYEKAMKKANNRDATSLVQLRTNHPSAVRGRYNIMSDR